MIKEKTVLAMETGEYSDYSVLGFFEAVVDVDEQKVVDEYLSQHPQQKQMFHFDHYQFVAWLVEKGYLRDIDYARWFIGSYGQAPSEMSTTPGARGEGRPQGKVSVDEYNFDMEDTVP